MHERPVRHPPEIGARRGRWTSPGRVDAGLPRNRCGNGLHDLLPADAALAVHPATARGTFAPRAVVITAVGTAPVFELSPRRFRSERSIRGLHTAGLLNRGRRVS